jgi:hypothetical protein
LGRTCSELSTWSEWSSIVAAASSESLLSVRQKPRAGRWSRRRGCQRANRDSAGGGAATRVPTWQHAGEGGVGERHERIPGQPGTDRTHGTWRRKSRRGERHRARLNPESDRTHRFVEQSLEAPTGRHGGRATGQCPHDKGQGGSRRRRDGDAAEREKPLDGEPWTWLRDETSPRCRWWSKPSRG